MIATSVELTAAHSPKGQSSLGAPHSTHAVLLSVEFTLAGGGLAATTSGDGGGGDGGGGGEATAATEAMLPSPSFRHVGRIGYFQS